MQSNNCKASHGVASGLLGRGFGVRGMDFYIGKIQFRFVCISYEASGVLEMYEPHRCIRFKAYPDGHR